MHKHLLLFIMLMAFASYYGHSQGNQFNFSYSNPTDLGICSQVKTFSVTVTNISTNNFPM